MWCDVSEQHVIAVPSVVLKQVYTDIRGAAYCTQSHIYLNRELADV